MSTSERVHETRDEDRRRTQYVGKIKSLDHSDGLGQEPAQPHREPNAQHHGWKDHCVALERDGGVLGGFVVAGDIDVDGAPLVEGGDDEVDEEAAQAADAAGESVVLKWQVDVLLTGPVFAVFCLVFHLEIIIEG